MIGFGLTSPPLACFERAAHAFTVESNRPERSL
jgi:hypothetical protein